MPAPPAELHDLLALSLVPGLGPKLTAELLRRFGSAAAARRATAGQLLAVPRVGPKLAADFTAALRSLDLAAELALLERHGVGLLALGSPEYPALLAEIDSPPPLLFLRGALTPADANAVAIVGTRHCTAYGRRVTERIAADLARAGVCVVSGLARGIDGMAHKAALAAGGRTVAVLAGGLAHIYPPEHADLADRVSAAGCLVTETPMTVQPQPGMFPARNRIISGLCRAVVIVEAGEKSGALITADHAADQGREVMAVPGPADGEQSAGCLRLLRDGARLVRSAEDILEDLNTLPTLTDEPPGFTPRGGQAPNPAGVNPAARQEAPIEPAGLDPTQRQIWEALTDGPKHVDELTRLANLPVAQLSGVLMLLEVKKVVRRLPGNLYERR